MDNLKISEGKGHKNLHELLPLKFLSGKTDLKMKLFTFFESK